MAYEPANEVDISLAGVGAPVEECFGGKVRGWDAEASSVTVESTTDCLAYSIVSTATSVFVTVRAMLREAAELLQTACRLAFGRAMRWRRYLKPCAALRASCLQMRC